jgi:uncharacterized membrane protein
MRPRAILTTAFSATLIACEVPTVPASVENFLPQFAKAQLPLEVLDLGPGVAWEVGPQGFVVGESGGRPTIWKDGTPTVLEPTDRPGRATSINARGEITVSPPKGVVSAGYLIQRRGIVEFRDAVVSDNADGGQVVGFTHEQGAWSWKSGVATNLPPLPGHHIAQAWGVNERGDVVGTSFSASGYEAVIWTKGTPTRLGRGGSPSSRGRDLNNSGEAVGWSLDESGQQRAMYWTRNGDVVRLPDLGASSSVAFGINDRGDISGWIEGPFGAAGGQLRRAVVWAGQDIIILPPLSLGEPSQAYGISARGKVAGYSGGHAVVWSYGAPSSNLPSEINGTVAVDDLGLANVTVTLSGDGAGSTTTVLDGSYTFAGLHAGTYAVSISGFDSEAYSFSHTSVELQLAIGDTRVIDFHGSTPPPPGADVWTKMDTPAHLSKYMAVWGTSVTDVFVGGIEGRPDLNESPGAMLHFDGTSWEQQELPEGTRGVFSISGTASNNVYATAWGRLLHYDGNSWSVELEMPSQNSNDWLWSVWAGAEDEVVVVGAQGRVLRFDGTAWTDESGFTDVDLYDVTGSGSLVIASGRFDLFHRDGGVWVRRSDLIYWPGDGIHGVYAVSPTLAYAVNPNLAVYDGESWTERSQPPLGDHMPGGEAVWASSDADIVVASGVGWPLPVIATYDGASWTVVVPEENSGGLLAVWGTPDGRDVFVVGGGQPGTVFRRRR